MASPIPSFKDPHDYLLTQGFLCAHLTGVGPNKAAKRILRPPRRPVETRRDVARWLRDQSSPGPYNARVTEQALRNVLRIS